MQTEQHVKQNLAKYQPYINKLKIKYKKYKYYDEHELESWAHQGIIEALKKVDKNKNESSFVMAYINNYILLGLRNTGGMMGSKTVNFFRDDNRQLNNSIVSITDWREHNSELQLADTLPSGEPTPYDLLEQADSSQYLHDTIDSLPEEDQIIIKERFFNNATYKEIADKLNCSQPLIGIRIKSIMEKMKYLILDKI